MRRMLWVWLAMPVVGCTCYERPTIRDLRQIGAPSVTVAPTGFNSPAPDAPPTAEATVTAQGQVSARSERGFTFKPDSGQPVELQIDERTVITLEGREVGAWVLSEGDEVRASWSKTRKGPVAEAIRVLPSKR